MITTTTRESSQAMRWRSVALVVGTCLAIALITNPVRGWVAASPAPAAWATTFLAIFVQAIPFLALGVLVSASITAFLPAGLIARLAPRHPAVAIPTAGAAGILLPGCECGSVPISAALMRQGLTPAAALTFLLAAPAINPVVIVSTYIAFAGDWRMAAARYVASVATALIMGFAWLFLGRERWMKRPREAACHRTGHRSRVAVFRTTMQHDFLHAGGFLVVGAAVAATVNVAVPSTWVQTMAANPALSILILATLAVLVAMCSEADAFVAAALTQFSLTARLAFMVVGPAVDVKLIALQAGTFGKGFAVRFSAATFVVAVASAATVGKILL